MRMSTNLQSMDGVNCSMNDEPLPVPEDDEDDRLYCGLLEED